MAELEANSASPSDDQRAPSPPPDSSDHRDDPEHSRPPPTVALPKEKRVASEKQREALRRAREAKKANAEVNKKVKKQIAPVMRIKDEPVTIDFDDAEPPPVREDKPRPGGINLLFF